MQIMNIEKNEAVRWKGSHNKLQIFKQINETQYHNLYSISCKTDKSQRQCAPVRWEPLTPQMK